MGKGNTNESQIQDIESSIIIRTQEKKYFVVQLLRELTEEGFYTRFLIVKKNKKTIARIAFPSSEDVKNLSVNINNKKKHIHPQINIKKINFLYYLENTP